MRQSPITHLPPDYQPQHAVNILDDNVLQVLGRYNLYLIVPFIVGTLLWHMLVRGMVNAPSPDLTLFHHALLSVLAGVGTLIIHEGIHGLAMFWAGHKPRFGIFFKNKIPVALYATTDNGFFQRTPFIIMALAPLVIITALGLGLMVVLPVNLHLYIGLALVINGTGAAGDLYMSQLAWRYDEATTLIQDHSEGITIFTICDK
jgi:hypothetical protein